MNITEQISLDLTSAMKVRDNQKVQALRMIRAAFIETEKLGKGFVTDERVPIIST